ncbi:MAG: fumarate reductase subunit C [Rhodoferax sp.]|nr:fumarate reductase subunit C [Rhodoferax sp.]
MTPRRPPAPQYVRPMRGWWLRHSRARRYMLREGSALFLVVYALVLLVGLLRLVQGEAAFAAWRAALGHPLAVAWHGLTLLLVLYHSITWFQVMPKTMPTLPLRPGWITAASIVSMLLLSAALLAVLRWGVG